MTLIEPIFCAHMIIIYDASETAPFLMRRIIKFSRLLETHRYFVVLMKLLVIGTSWTLLITEHLLELIRLQVKEKWKWVKGIKKGLYYTGWPAVAIKGHTINFDASLNQTWTN